MPQFLPKEEWELHEFTSDCECSPIAVYKGPAWRMAVLFGETIHIHQPFSPLGKVGDGDELEAFVVIADVGTFKV